LNSARHGTADAARYAANLSDRAQKPAHYACPVMAFTILSVPTLTFGLLLEALTLDPGGGFACVTVTSSFAAIAPMPAMRLLIASSLSLALSTALMVIVIALPVITAFPF
jgi:hypothetical protein